MRKNGDGNVFQNLTKTVDNLFGKNSIIYFYNSRPRSLVLYKSVFAKRRTEKTQISRTTNLFAKNWPVTLEISPRGMPGQNEKQI